jgi:hypothetical protein
MKNKVGRVARACLPLFVSPACALPLSKLVRLSLGLPPHVVLALGFLLVSLQSPHPQPPVQNCWCSRS